MTIKPSKDTRKETGKKGEEAASAYMAEQGYRIVERNWRCRTGEIDLIAWNDGTIVFVEVRTRTKKGVFGTPEESINYRKQKQVRETAQFYLYQHKKYDASIRFDVISIYLNTDGSLAELNHIKHAF